MLVPILEHVCALFLDPSNIEHGRRSNCLRKVQNINKKSILLLKWEENQSVFYELNTKKHKLKKKLIKVRNLSPSDSRR